MTGVTEKIVTDIDENTQSDRDKANERDNIIDDGDDGEDSHSIYATTSGDRDDDTDEAEIDRDESNNR